MSGANFYQILGVVRSASADQIKSAHRDLVKRYHPDLFSTVAEKNEATEKLRLINEAYAVLGNAKRREQYNQRFMEKPEMRARASTAPPRPRRQQAPRQAGLRPKRKSRLVFPKKWALYSLGPLIVFLFFIYSSRGEPRLVAAWGLWEKTEVLPLRGRPSNAESGQWVRLREYGSVEECAAMVRKLVRDDEKAGAKAVLDETNGIMAIVVNVMKDESRQAPTTQRDPRNDGQQLLTPEPSAAVPAVEPTKRVRNLECRATQRLETESWLRRNLRTIGVLS